MVKIAILGTGSIGAFVGGELVLSGQDVIFIGRAYLKQDIERHGLTLTPFSQKPRNIPSSQIKFQMDLNGLEDREYILVCVKSKETMQVALDLFSAKLNPKAVIVSFQNGIENGPTLRNGLGRNYTVLEAMVSFGVDWSDNAHFICAVPPIIVIEMDNDGNERSLLEAFRKTSIKCASSKEISGILHSKLLVNALNNPIAALTNKSFKEYVLNPYTQAILSQILREGITAVKAAGIKLVSYDKALSPFLLSYLLALPIPILKLVLRLRMGNKNSNYKSSMWVDMNKGRKTEIDEINGVIVDYGKKFGVPTPVNEKVIALIKKHETKQPQPNYTPEQLYSLTIGEGAPNKRWKNVWVVIGVLMIIYLFLYLI